MVRISAIGIGTGNPAHLTVEAIARIQKLDFVLVLDKGEETADMRAFRAELLETHCPDRLPQIVTVKDPKRDEELAARDYREAVRHWHRHRAEILGTTIAELETEKPEAEIGFLVWGDPSLYDSTLRIMASVRENNPALVVKSIPGITAPSVLCAAFAIPANRIGQAIHITTGRALAQTAAGLLENCFVMLDGNLSFRELDLPETTIYWGAYLGDRRETLISGNVNEVSEAITEARSLARTKNGWIMDTYLLRAHRKRKI